MSAISVLCNALGWSRLWPPDRSADARVAVFTSPAAIAAAILYVISALCAVVGVWRMKSWAAAAVVIWGVTVFLRVGVFVVEAKPGSPVALSVIAADVVIVTLMWVYVRRKLSRVEL